MTPSQHNAFPAGRWTIPAGTDRKVLTLFKRGRSWFARFTGPEAGNIIRLFGTNEICTAFQASAPVEDVKTEISKLNFDYTIVVESL